MTPSSSSAADSAGSSNAAAAGSGSAELPDAARLEWLWGEYEKQMEQIKQQQEEGMDIYPTMGQAKMEEATCSGGRARARRSQ